jgi:hypothetical protein
LTTSGIIKRAPASIIVEWISKTWKEVSVSIIALSNVEDGMQDAILWDDSEQSGEGSSASENESAIEGSLGEHSNEIEKID